MSDSRPLSLSSCNFDLYMNEIAQWFVPAIVSEPTLSRIQEVLSALPGKTTNAIGLEFYPSDSDYDCDISLSIDPFVDKNELIAWRPDEFNKNYKNHTLIRDITFIPEIVGIWEDPQSRLSEVIKEMIPEIDLRAPVTNNIPLNIFLTLVQNCDPGKIRDILSPVLSGKLDGTEKSNIPACLDRIAKLPKDLFITHLGFMVGRPSKAIRVLIRCKTVNLCSVLRTLGLNTEEYLSFGEFFNIIQPRCSFVVIAANMFQQGIGTDFAVECGIVEPEKPDADEWWADFIGAIGALGHWDAQISTMLHVQTLIKRRSALLQTNDYVNNPIKWGLNHIKLSFSKKERPTMKWYMAMHGVAANASVNRAKANQPGYKLS